MRTLKLSTRSFLFCTGALVTGLFLGCAGQKAGERNRGVAGTFTLEVQAATDEVSVAEIAEGARMRSGDTFTLKLSTKRPLYVYVQQQGSSGTLSPLYPPDMNQTQPLQPTGPVRLPEVGSFRLDETPGTERYYMIAAVNPLSADQLKAELTRASEASGKREPPTTSNTQNRGASVSADLRADGIGALVFRLVHE